jgi:hypothetical protein
VRAAGAPSPALPPAQRAAAVYERPGGAGSPRVSPVTWLRPPGPARPPLAGPGGTTWRTETSRPETGRQGESPHPDGKALWMEQVEDQAAREASLDKLEQIELTVSETDRSGVRARWESGHILLAARGEAKRLPNGYLEEACNRLRKSESELGYRMQFAARFPTEAELPKVLGLSWWEIITNHLAKSDAQLRNSSESNEWYTPARYVESARKVMGGIDLDPASCVEANRIVHAQEFYTKDQDGLNQPLYGRVWCNPPYGGTAGKFAARLVEAHQDGDIEAAVLLVSAHATDAGWFQQLWDYHLCFTDHRISFISSDGSQEANTAGSVFAYLGEATGRFEAEFARHGAVVKRAGFSSLKDIAREVLQ